MFISHYFQNMAMYCEDMFIVMASVDHEASNSKSRADPLSLDVGTGYQGEPTSITTSDYK